MPTLIAIAFPNERTATVAAGEAQTLVSELAVEPGSVALIRRDREGMFHVTTNHQPVSDGADWSMFWSPLFSFLFFVPVFGMAVGSGLGALVRGIEHAGIDRKYQDRARDLLQPGTSAVFLVVDSGIAGRVVEALRSLGGIVLTSSIREQEARELQQQLHGVATTGTVS